jgi:O-antigen/teichoic acid export membrane protein
MFLGVPKSLVQRLGWTSLSYGISQAIRLVTNVVLARLLAPEILGIMALVNAIRTGVQLLSDVGINQNIVSNPRGSDPDFYDTAWTLQALRGVALAALCASLAIPAARFFNHAELAAILPVASIFFIFTGLDSTGRGLLQKQLNVARYGMFDIIVATVTLVAHVVAALITRTVWALVMGSLASGAAILIASFLYIPGIRHRFIIDRQSARELLQFGKWVFFSSIVFFLAMNFDRLYFAKQISLAQLGVYGIARGLADVISIFISTCSSTVLFPTIAAAGLAPVDLRKRILRGRRTLLFAAAVGMGVFLALSDVIIELLYDPRYSQAGLILPILCIGVWFGILTATNDSILMGLSRPAYPALSNAAKLATYVVGMPLAFRFYGLGAAIAVISAGEIVKYATLWLLSHKEHLRFGRDDFVLTAAFLLTAVICREGTHALGLSAGFGPLATILAGGLR